MSGRRTVVLVGAGHAHLHVAAHAEAFRARGARLLLIDPGCFWYSGLATGMLGGMYPPAADQLDPRVLIEARGGEFLAGRVIALNAAERRLRLADGRELDYDLVSLNLGSRVATETLPELAAGDGVWPVKPIANLWELRMRLESRIRKGEHPRVAVIGAGPTGIEVAANLVALARRHGGRLSATLITREVGIARAAPPGAARRLRRELMRRGVAVRTGIEIRAREPGAVIGSRGERIEADTVVLATGLRAASLINESGLPVDPHDGLLIGGQLTSVADHRVFAAGDCACLADHRLPKLGVFGVRQAPVLLRNLLASLDHAPLTVYRPQKRYLAILNLGGKGLAIWGPLWWLGRASLWLKDRIDRRFMTAYRRLYAGR